MTDAAARTSDDPARTLAVAAARAASEKLGGSPAVLAVGDVVGIVEYFVVTSGRNPPQVKAIVDEVERVAAVELNRRPRGVEGLDGRRWVLIDFGDVVVHVFDAEEREHYRLERLYADVPTVVWEA